MEIRNETQSFKGYETWSNNMQMSRKMYKHLFRFFLIAYFVLVAGICAWGFNEYYYTPYYQELWHDAFSQLLFSVLDFNFARSEEIVEYLVGVFMDDLLPNIKKVAFWSLSLFTLYPFVIWRFHARAKEQVRDKFIRGARSIKARKLKRAIRRNGETADLPLGSVKMPLSAETKHCFIIGRPGVGKTVAISAIVERLRERGDKGIVYDFKGDYLSKLYDAEKDIIFNPLDLRSQGWSLFNDIETHMDIDAVSHSLIPSDLTDRFFNEGARDVFAGILHYLYEDNLKTNADIWKAATTRGKEIADRLEKTKGGERGFRNVEDASGKQALSIFAVFMQYAKAFEYMANADGDFSITKWLKNDKPGFIFVTNYSDIRDTLRPILSLFVDLVGRKLLSMQEDHKRRVFFILDEFGTLQRLPTIVQLLTLSRSKGGSCWIGIQDVGQIDKIYTPSLRQSIVNACGSSLTFSVADPDTSKFLSDKIGEAEYLEIEETSSMGTSENRDGITLVRRKQVRKIVLPSEIHNLPDLTAYLKLPNYDLTRTQFSFVDRKNITEPFVMRPDLMLDNS